MGIKKGREEEGGRKDGDLMSANRAAVTERSGDWLIVVASEWLHHPRHDTQSITPPGHALDTSVATERLSYSGENKN